MDHTNKLQSGGDAVNAKRVFISYGRADSEELAFRIEHDLSQLGYRVWLDKRKIMPGGSTSWEEQIEIAILDHEIFLALLSPHAVRRPDGVCLDEISFARYHGRNIIPAMVFQCQPPLGIYRLDWIDFQEWREPIRYKQSVERLLNALKSGPNAEGLYARIFSKVKPLDFRVELGKHTTNFVGRKWLFSELDRWLQESASHAFFITGDPGSGKSAVMSYLAQKHPRVAAYHFCVAGLDDTLSPTRFIRSIAAQLSSQLGNFRGALEPIPIEESINWSPDDLFRKLLANPLRAESPGEPLLLLIDALDVAFDSTRKNIPVLLRDRMDELPSWLRIVISSRKNPEILDFFSRYHPHEIEATRSENLDDIAAYLERNLSRQNLLKILSETGRSLQATVDLISRKGQGNFLYAVEALKSIGSGLIQIDDPNTFPDGLVLFYRETFERIFPNPGNYMRFRPALDVVCSALEPLSSLQIAAITNCDVNELENELQLLSGFFPERNGRYQAFHKSVTDWLCGKVGHDKTYRVNLLNGHNLISKACWEEYSNPKAIKSEYCLSYAPAHFIASGDWDHLLAFVTDPQLRLISRWIEYGETDTGVTYLKALIDYLEQTRKDSVFSAGLATQLARIYSLWAQDDEAETWLQYALERTTWYRGRRIRAIAIHELGSLNLYRHDLSAASRLYFKALLLSFFGMTQDLDEASANLLGLGSVCQTQYHFRKEQYYALAGKLCAVLSRDVVHNIAARRLLAHALRALGRYTKAELHLRKAIRLCDQHGVILEKARVELSLGWLLYKIAVLQEQPLTNAKTQFCQALENADSVQDVFIQTEAKLCLGWCALIEKSTDEAKTWISPILTALPSERHPELRAGIKMGSALIVHQEGDLKAAKRLYEELKSFCIEKKSYGWLRRVSIALGSAHWHLGNVNEADHEWQEALEIASRFLKSELLLTRKSIELCRSDPFAAPR